MPMPPPGYYSRERLYTQLPWYPGLASMCPNQPEYAGITLQPDGAVSVHFRLEGAEAAIGGSECGAAAEAPIQVDDPGFGFEALGFESQPESAPAAQKLTRSQLVDIYKERFGKAPKGLRAKEMAAKLGLDSGVNE